MKTLMDLKTWRLKVVPEPCHEVDLIFERIRDKTWVIFCCVKDRIEVKNWDENANPIGIPFSPEELEVIQNTNKIYQGNEDNLKKLKIYNNPFGYCEYTNKCKCSECGNNFCSGYIKCKDCMKNNYNHKTTKCKSYVEYNVGNHKCPKEK